LRVTPGVFTPNAWREIVVRLYLGSVFLMFFFIDPSFASVCQASANDADIIAPFRMDDNQQLAAIGAGIEQHR